MPRTCVVVALLTLCACTSPSPSSVPRYPLRSVAQAKAVVRPLGSPSPAVAERSVGPTIAEQALATPSAYALLTELADDIGARPAGSEALARAVRWAEARLREGGSETRVEPVMVSKWTRGDASLAMLTPSARAIEVLAIGHSVPTPRAGIEAEVVVVDSREGLVQLGEAVRGKIVLFAVVMPPFDAENNDPGYGRVYWSRVHGASLAASQGARAVLVRSLSAHSRAGVHTGTLSYDAAVPRIPAATLSTEDADWIARLVTRGKTVRVRLSLSPREEARVPSANVVAELRGREQPDAIVLLGAHLDSWDVGQGAADDGAGVAITIDALNLLRRMGLVPRRTIRAVLFTNEEAGGDGARAYDEAHGSEHHVAAIETDTGGARVVGLGIDLADDRDEAAFIRTLEPILGPLRALGAERVTTGHAGADIGPLIKRGVPGIGLMHDVSHYFDVHHTRADTLDKIDPDALQQGVAAMATLVYALADMPANPQHERPRPPAGDGDGPKRP